MADVNRGNRPLSPHIGIYRPQFTSMLSILHRITGCALALGAVLSVCWLLAAATGPAQFAFVDAIATSWIGVLVWLGSTWALAYHFCNGIRHLWWDMGFGFRMDQVEASAKVVLAGSVGLTGIVFLLA